MDGSLAPSAVPAGQLVHSAAPASEYEPAEHSMHSVAADELEENPDWHSWQDVSELASVSAVPGAQLIQSADPAIGFVVPAAHASTLQGKDDRSGPRPTIRK